jgi:hypothetical protein
MVVGLRSAALCSAAAMRRQARSSPNALPVSNDALSQPALAKGGTIARMLNMRRTPPSLAGLAQTPKGCCLQSVSTTSRPWLGPTLA